jgi:hypothetical protein
MKRANTKLKEQKLLCEFHKLLRGGKDYGVDYMYQQAGKKVFLSSRQTQDIIRQHYNEKITIKMFAFLELFGDKPHEDKVQRFSKHFKMCEREGRLIINYIIRR